MKIRAILVMFVLIYCVRGGCESCRLPHPEVASDYVLNQSDDLNNFILNQSGDPGGDVLNQLDDLMDDPGRDVAPEFGVSIFFPLPQVYPEGAIYFEAFVFAGTPPYSFEWTSDVDGVMGWDEKFSVRDLSVNTHRITLRVWDDAGLKAMDNVSMTVTPRHPLQVSIISPENATYGQGTIRLTPSAYGGEKPYTFIWRLDGRDVEGIDNITAGIHSVGLKVIDSANVSVEDAVEFMVIDVCNKNDVCGHGETYLNCPQDCSDSRGEDADICNKNGVCELGIENYLNCPEDCSSGLEDGYCNALEDGVCDPDCEGNDPDCVGDGWFNYFILSIFVLILVLGYLKFIRVK